MIIAADRNASAQTVSIGVKGGVPLVDRTVSKDESRPYIVGPYIEIRLPAGFAVEADALYQRIGDTAGFGFPGANIIAVGTGFNQGPITTSFINRQRGNSWEFPLLGKYYFRPGESGLRPFVATGWAFRTISVHSDVNETNIDSSGLAHSLSFNGYYRSSLGVGAVFSAGVRFHAGRVSFVPEIRYTRWGASDNFVSKNEAGLLLGISF